MAAHPLAAMVASALRRACMLPTLLFTTSLLASFLLTSPVGARPILGPLLNGAILGLPDLEPILSNNTYDYVVVGAGTAGLALAHRLAQDPNTSVVVLEAGHDVATDLSASFLSDTPVGDTVGCGASDSDFAQNKIDWKIKTTPQRGCNGRVVRYARGKTAGGSSARNFMIYQRPPAETHRSWQELTGDDSWGYYEREADYKRPLIFTPPRQDLRHDNPRVPDTSADYGSDDPDSACVQISYPNYAQEFSGYLIDAMGRLGIPRARSFTDGTRLHGVQFCATTINPVNGHRSTSRCFYEKSQKQKNFKLFFKAHAKAIILTRGRNGTAKASGVTYSVLPDGMGTTNVVYANKEVIIAAGVFQSPQLLMVSGIGPEDQLSQHGIPRIVVNKNVGKNLQDHVFAGPSYRIDPSVKTLTRMAADPIYAAKQLALFKQRPPIGEATNNVADAIGFEMIPREEAENLGIGNLSDRFPGWPHIEIQSSPGLVKDFKNLYEYNFAEGLTGSRFVTALMEVVMPISTGSVTLRSRDTMDLPVVDPGWLTDVVDQKVAIWAFKRARQIFQQEPIRSKLLDNGAEFYPGDRVQTDDEILDSFRSMAMTVWHASCTCSMQKRELGGVLDSRLRVYDVESLRVVDASSFPRLLPGHPTSVLYMLAERAATLIKEDNA